MASPCEVLFETEHIDLVKPIAQQVAAEAWRIEDKFSRYKTDNICHAINHSEGKKVSIDQECYQLLCFAEQCFQLSDGLFDLTSGILRRIWQFNGQGRVPNQSQIDALLPYIGWQKLDIRETSIVVPKNMELDFGGIGKEYAVDKALKLVSATTKIPTLINFGGDLAVTSCRNNGDFWQVGIEHPGFENNATAVIAIRRGALATSGDAKRFIQYQGKRYSHILNAKTGWPISDAPRSITVAAEHCIEAGLLSSLAMLQGKQAQQFLLDQEVKHWLVPF